MKIFNTLGCCTVEQILKDRVSLQTQFQSFVNYLLKETCMNLKYDPGVKSVLFLESEVTLHSFHGTHAACRVSSSYSKRTKTDF